MSSHSQNAVDAEADPAIAWVARTAKDFSDDADALRASTDRAAKILIALASTGLTAVGIANVGAVYPWPSRGSFWGWPIVLFVAFALMVACVVSFVLGFWKANRALPMSTARENFGSAINEREWTEIERIYQEAMKHAPFTREVKSIGGYEQQADRWEQDALLTPDSPISARR